MPFHFLLKEEESKHTADSGEDSTCNSADGCTHVVNRQNITGHTDRSADNCSGNDPFSALCFKSAPNVRKLTSDSVVDKSPDS